jgi:hypothetical protein
MAKNKFLQQDKYSRYFGGSKGENPLDVYVTGFHYLFVDMPDKLKQYIISNCAASSGVKGKYEITEPAEILSIHNTSVTPPGSTLGKTTHTSIGNMKWNNPTTLELGDEITCKFNEYAGVPIYRIHRAWVNFIIDTNLGLNNHPEPVYVEDMKANMWYATTRPDGKTIEFGAKFTGVWPTKSPTDIFVSDIASSDKIDVDMSYSIDHMYDNNKEVLEALQTKINAARETGIKFNAGRPAMHTGGSN